MKKITFKNRITRYFSLFLIYSLVITGISFTPIAKPIKASAKNSRRMDDHRVVEIPERIDLGKVDGDEAKELKRQVVAASIDNLGDYTKLLDSVEKEYNALIKAAVGKYAPYGTQDTQEAAAKYGAAIQISQAAYNELVDDSQAAQDSFSLRYQHAIEAAIYDNVDKVQYVLCSMSGFTCWQDGGTYYASTMATAQDPRNFNSMNQKLANARSRLLGSLKELKQAGISAVEKEIIIHDALLDNVTYYEGYQTAPSQHICYTAYGALVEGSAVCDGYSQALAYLLEAVNIDAFVVTGGAAATPADAQEPGAGHAWNMVKFGNSAADWYEVDSTWDDYEDNEEEESVIIDKRHEYFNVTTDYMETVQKGSTMAHFRVPPFVGENITDEATGTEYSYEALALQYPDLFINEKATSLDIDIDSQHMFIGEEVTATATLEPEDLNNTFVKWITSDSLVADVDGGVITAVGSGKATITAVAGSNMEATDKIEVTVQTPATSMTLNKSKLTMKVGDSFTLVQNALPNADDNDDCTWKTSDEKVATVENGVVKATGIGIATITATSTINPDASATCTVTVPQITGLTLDKSTMTMKIGESYTLIPTPVPNGEDFGICTWTSSDEKVATVANGKVTAIGSGTATITATSVYNSAVSAICTVTVSQAAGSDITVGEGNKAFYYSVTGADNTVAFTGTGNKKSKSVSIPEEVKDANGVSYTVTEISKGALKGRKNLKKLIVPKTVTTIRKNACKGCSKLSKITLYGDNLSKVESGAFSGLAKNAKFTIKASTKAKYNKAVKKIKKAGAKNATFKWSKIK